MALQYFIRTLNGFPKITLALVLLEILQAASFAHIIYLIGKIVGSVASVNMSQFLMPIIGIFCFPWISYFLLKIALAENHQPNRWNITAGTALSISPSFAGRAIISLAESVALPSSIIAAPFAAFVFIFFSTDNYWLYPTAIGLAALPIAIIYIETGQKCVLAEN